MSVSLTVSKTVDRGDVKRQGEGLGLWDGCKGSWRCMGICLGGEVKVGSRCKEPAENCPLVVRLKASYCRSSVSIEISVTLL